MFRKQIIFLLCCAWTGHATAQKPGTLKEQLEQIRAKHNLPALAAIAVKNGKILATASTGVRKMGSDIPVTDDDQWHIGSCTKSMTATLAAMLVQQGKLKWDTTVGDIFPEWKSEMNPPWAGVTLEQLLTHRSGAPHDAPADLSRQADRQIGTPTEQRLAFVHGLVTRPPEAPPGSKYIYSNQGYVIAGAMLERVTGKAWEELMRTMIFEPLGMTSAGFGAPGSADKMDEPWGHTPQLIPVPPGPKADNPPAIGPAGTVHCSLADFARYAAMHAGGEQTGSALLKPEGFVKLHTPAQGQDYAMGWIVCQRDWAGGRAFNHVGSNTMFLVNIWIAPSKKMVFIAATNIGNNEAFPATDEAMAAMIGRFLKP